MLPPASMSRGRQVLAAEPVAARLSHCLAATAMSPVLVSSSTMSGWLVRGRIRRRFTGRGHSGLLHGRNALNLYGA